jgi:hypothetical protein
MNYLNKLVFTVLACFACVAFTVQCYSTTDGHAFPEQLGVSIFKIVKANQIDKLDTYLATKEELVHRMNNSTYHQSKKKQFLERADQLVKTKRENLRKNFASIREAAVKEGIDWSKARITKIQYEVMKHRFVKAHIEIFFAVDGYEYNFGLWDCLVVERGWMIGERISWGRQQKKKLPEAVLNWTFVPEDNKMDEFGKEIFNTFKENKLDKFRDYFITREDMIELLDKYYKDGEKKKDWLNYFDEAQKDSLNSFLYGFKRVRDEKSMRGLDWSKAKLSFVAHSSTIRFNVRHGRIKLIITDGGRREHKISLSCIKVKRGWRLNY